MTAKAGVLPLRAAAMGTVTSVAGNNANGFTVGVTNPTSTPTITVGTSLIGLMVGDGTAATALPFPGGTTTFLRADGSFATPASGTGTVTSVSVVSANGLAGTVATATTTPAITLTTSITGLLKGNGTAISAAASGTDYSAGTSALGTGIVKTTTGTGALTVAVAGDFPTLNQNTTGTAASITGIETVVHGGTGLATLTANNLLVGAGTSNVTFIAPGASGNVLTSNGSTWASTAAAGGGSWVFLSAVTASSASTIDVETTFDATYDMYAITIPNLTMSAAVGLTLRMKLAGAYVTTSTYYGHSSNTTSAAATYNGAVSNAASAITIFGGGDVTAGNSMNLVIWVFSPAATNNRKSVTWQGIYNAIAVDTFVTTINGGGGNNGQQALTGIRLLPASGTLTGVVRLYGIKNS